MSAPRPAPSMPAYGWCAVLAAANDDVLGTALAEVCTRHRPRAPELLEVTHYRHHTVEATGTAWYLFIAAVMGDSEGELADTHPALARDLWRAADLWTHSFPKFRKFPPGHAALARYHRTPAGLVLPAPPPPRVSAAWLAPPKRVERAEPEVARTAAPVPEQKGLFG